jgi:hypothetical protein
VSVESTCEDPLECSLPGQCVGSFIHLEAADSHVKCHVFIETVPLSPSAGYIILRTGQINIVLRLWTTYKIYVFAFVLTAKPSRRTPARAASAGSRDATFKRPAVRQYIDKCTVLSAMIVVKSMCLWREDYKSPPWSYSLFTQILIRSQIAWEIPMTWTYVHFASLMTGKKFRVESLQT